MGWSIGFLFAALGAASNFLWWWSRRKQAQPEPPPEAALRYGHPYPPVPSLRSKLPVAPDSHRWEIKVTTDNTGEQWLHLTLVNIATEQNVATEKLSLTKRKYGQHWAAWYRDFKIIAKEHFWNEVIGPLADWAQVQVNKFSCGTNEYRMD